MAASSRIRRSLRIYCRRPPRDQMPCCARQGQGRDVVRLLFGRWCSGTRVVAAGVGEARCRRCDDGMAGLRRLALDAVMLRVSAYIQTGPACCLHVAAECRPVGAASNLPGRCWPEIAVWTRMDGHVQVLGRRAGWDGEVMRGTGGGSPSPVPCVSVVFNAGRAEHKARLVGSAQKITGLATAKCT